MTEQRTQYSEAELLETHEFEEPLFAGDVRCHGGFDANGKYVSPRTRHRAPAILAWQARHREQFGQELLDLPLETWPSHYPNVAQAKLLVRNGVIEPMITTLTRIGTIEGFGASIRNSVLPDLERCFEEELAGTATLHLQQGLYEAHARDEAGFEGEGGHKQMWFAARDIAFEHPKVEDLTEQIMARMGFPGAGGKLPSAEQIRKLREQQRANRLWPDDVDLDLEFSVARMCRLLLIEISAFHTFAWAEEVLSDTELFAGDGAAARLVSYIRADETPHVEYLKTTLTEMRDRTFVGSSRRKYKGSDLIGQVWDRSRQNSLGPNREEAMRNAVAEVERALEGHPRRPAILEEFHALADEPST